MPSSSIRGEANDNGAILLDGPGAVQPGGGICPGEMAGKRTQDDIVVFWIRRDSRCRACGQELERGSLLRLREGEALCLECADLDHLVYLPRGDAALTRRASKHSRLRAVVVQWARARNRYERQGILVEEAALRQAEQECLSDAEARAARREREAAWREGRDREYVARFAGAIRERYPGCPEDAAAEIAEHACRKHSGRVGRSAMAKRLDPEAVDLAVRAHLRHAHTRYDDLLMAGWDRSEARAQIEGELEEAVAVWERVGPQQASSVGRWSRLVTPARGEANR